MQTVVEAEGLTKVYAPRHRGAKPVVAVDGIRFAVRAGQVTDAAGSAASLRFSDHLAYHSSSRR